MYCSIQDLINRFGEHELISISDHENVGGIDESVIDMAITDAAAEIDAYIGARYSVPLTSIPAVLTVHACNITRYRLYDERSLDEVTERYKQAISFLKMVADGKGSLGIETGKEQQISHRVTAKKGVSATDWGTY